MTAPSPVAGSARDDARDLQAGFVQPARKTVVCLRARVHKGGQGHGDQEEEEKERLNHSARLQICRTQPRWAWTPFGGI
jgi:hypothetical protein